MAYNAKEVLSYWRSNIIRIHAGGKAKSIPRILTEREERTPAQMKKHAENRAKLIRVNSRVVRRSRTNG